MHFGIIKAIRMVFSIAWIEKLPKRVIITFLDYYWSLLLKSVTLRILNQSKKMKSQDIKPRVPQDEHIVENVELNIWEALIPVVALIIMLFFNVFFVYGDDALSGSNQFILLLGGAVAAIVGFFNKVSYKQMIEEVAENVKSTAGAILILLMVGSLAGTWLISGIIPTMIYYGLQILNPTIFLAACVIICAIISVATGSSWTTSATVGIALIGIGNTLGISAGMSAGAVLSGAYFGDKMSPLSDTTNLAPAMAGAELFDHIKYMAKTTVPTISITLVIFIIMGFTIETTGSPDISDKLTAISDAFNISPWLFIVPVVVIYMITRKTPPLVALLAGTLLGAVAAIIAQPDIVAKVAGAESLTFLSAYKGVMNAMTVDTAVETSSAELNDLFSAGGMYGMLSTIWLIICAMVFGGVMDAIGALSRISQALLSVAKSTFGLFASTVASCLALNVTASDQYLALVVPGKMFKKAYEDKGLAPENLSRTLEDSGTVTSVLVPWNTCGAYQSGVLGVSVMEYFVFAIFNWLSPFMTLLFAAFNIKIKQLTESSNP
jgi:NhaC family Na+:H+ antiporter